MDDHGPLANLGRGNPCHVHQLCSSNDQRLLVHQLVPCRNDEEYENAHEPNCGRHDQCSIVYRLDDVQCHGDSNHYHQNRIHFSAMATFSL